MIISMLEIRGCGKLVKEAVSRYNVNWQHWFQRSVTTSNRKTPKCWSHEDGRVIWIFKSL